MRYMFWSVAIPLIFFVLMFVICVISQIFCNCTVDKDSEALEPGILFACIMTAPVLLEELYTIWLYKHIGLDIFNASYGTGGLLITLSIVLGFIVLVYLFASIVGSPKDDYENEFGSFFLELVLLIFGLLAIFMCRGIEKDEAIKKIEWKEVNQYEIQLQPINGDDDTTYIVINSQNNEIYYNTNKGNGAIIQDKMSYNTETFDIFQDNNEVPRIKVITYERQLLTPKGKILKEEYYDMHIIYIPEGKYSGNIN